MVGTLTTPIWRTSAPTISTAFSASNMLPMSRELFTTPTTSPFLTRYPHLTFRPNLPDRPSASGLAKRSTSIPRSVPATMSSLDPLPGDTTRFSGLTAGVLSNAPMASTLDLRMPLPVLSPQEESLRNERRTPSSMTVRLSVGVPSSSKTQESGAGTVGSSTMVTQPEATSWPRESFQRLLPYLTFSPLIASPTDDMIMSPSCPGGSIIDISPWPS